MPLADGLPVEQTTIMANPAEPIEPRAWRTGQVYAMAIVCLAIGLVLGYLFRRSASQSPKALQATTAASADAPAHPQMPSLEDMKRMADKQAEPLLARLKSEPNNSTLLNEIGTIYKSTHQFKEAAGYYQKAIDADPKNVAARTDLASCLYYTGDVDGALNQLQKSLTYDPKDANTLFNLGMIRFQGKNDANGAIAAWQTLLRSNPKLPDDKKASVEKLIADAQKRSLSGN